MGVALSPGELRDLGSVLIPKHFPPVQIAQSRDLGSLTCEVRLSQLFSFVSSCVPAVPGPCAAAASYPLCLQLQELPLPLKLFSLLGSCVPSLLCEDEGPSQCMYVFGFQPVPHALQMEKHFSDSQPLAWEIPASSTFRGPGFPPLSCPYLFSIALHLRPLTVRARFGGVI